MDSVSLVELLNEISGATPSDASTWSNRFVGISRADVMNPGGTLLITAHRELEAVPRPRSSALQTTYRIEVR
jgi:argininosuccinate synthase